MKFRKIISWLVLLILLCGIAAILLFTWLEPYYQRAKSFDLSKIDEFNVTTIFYDRHGEEVGRLFVEDRILLTHDQIPDMMRKAVVAVEDQRFYSHHGIDLRGTLRALRQNLRSRRVVQGGSTLTQQLAKHLIGNYKRTLDRKLLEAFLAWRIEKAYSKDQILDYYLNRIYFGRSYFGIGVAARGYFNKSAEDLTVGECALLAGIIKAPNVRLHDDDMENTLRWRNAALRKMVDQKMITSMQAGEMQVADIQLFSPKPSGKNSYFMSFATQELERVLGLENGEDIPQGLRVYTTLDLQMQKDAEAEVSKKLEQIESSKLLYSDKEPLQAAALVLDTKSAAIRILVGGRDFKESPFDRATMARREHGAILQPFLYALAFEQLNLHPASMINASYLDPADLSKPEEVALGDPDKNLAKRFLTIQDALALSNANCATRVGLQLGMKNFVQWLHSAGIANSERSHPETFEDLKLPTLLETTSLYQALGNDGYYLKPYSIQSVINSRDEVIYKKRRSDKTSLLNELTAQQMTLTLQAADRDGTASSLLTDYSIPAPFAGMTGYSAGYRDSWFVGFTPELTGGVWMGYDESKPIGNKAVATQAALPLWGSIMQKVLLEEPGEAKFSVPESLSRVEVDRRTGVIKGLGFLTPSSGHILCYLKQNQMAAARDQELSAANIRPPDDWSEWLNTMFAEAADRPGRIESLQKTDDSPPIIPPVAEYHMPGLRGDILTAEGEPMTTTIQTYTLALPWPGLEIARDDNEAVAWVLDRIKKAGEWLGQPIDITDAELRSLYHFQRFQPIIVAENLPDAKVFSFSQSALPAEGFALQEIPRRFYPKGHFFSQGLGYLQRKQGRNRKLYVADEVIYDRYAGAAGLEGIFDRDLTGEDGQFKVKTSPDGFSERAIVDKEATFGLNVRTTIRSKIQEAAERSIKKFRTGAVVVLDVKNGDVVAMASQPDFDPNSFIPALSPEMWKAMVGAEKNPLFNRAYQQRHPPGSMFKVITSIASMRKKGAFDPTFVLNCPGYIDVGNVHYNLPHEVGSYAYHDALVRSVNTYFINLGLKTGRDTLVQTAQDLGLGQPTGIILPDEAPGLMPTPDFVRVVHKRSMGAGDVANTSIGQGDLLVTPIQAANFMAAIANGGTLYQPRLVTQLEDRSGKAVKNFDPTITRQIAMPPELHFLKEAMIDVVEEGTATSAEISGIKMAAKTGTAQVGSKQRPRQIAWLGGYIPADHPEYAFAIMVEGDVDQSLHGGSTAGPIAKEIFSEVYGKTKKADSVATQKESNP